MTLHCIMQCSVEIHGLSLLQVCFTQQSFL
jgi:hypothetical protein